MSELLTVEQITKMYLDAVNKYDEQSRQTLFAIIPYAQEIENLRLELQGWRDTKTLKTPMCTCWSNPETGMLELGPDCTPDKHAPSARIPAKRAKPRVKRDRAPRPKPEAVKVFPDGREVCLNDVKHATAEGLLEYNRRRLVMAMRQDWHCADCYCQMLEAAGFTNSVTFDHEAKRGTTRDDRVWKEDGTPQNAALCWNCNAARGSIRTPYKFQTKLTRDEWEARMDGSR
jgi:hypothetical protein